MSTLLTKTTRRGKTIVVTLTQEEDGDRISITVDGEPVELDEAAGAGSPVELGPKTEKNMGLQPGAVSFGTTVLTSKEYEEMNQAWSEQSPRYRAKHEQIQEERRKAQAQRQGLEATIQRANSERDRIPKEAGEGEDAGEHLASVTQADEKIDQAALALRQFEALQKAA